MKGYQRMLALVGLSLLLGACSPKESPKESSQLHIGITQIVEHPALDAARKGFEDELKKLGVEAKVDFKSAQGEPQNAKLIAEKFVSDKADLIFAISTPSAQGAQSATEEIPILFTAVTDPVEAGLVESDEKPGKNITGTSDRAPVEEQLKLFQVLKPETKSVAIIYNVGEANSKVQIEEAKKVAEKLGLTIEEIGITNLSELSQAAEKACEADGIYTITDNLVASGIEQVAEAAKRHKKITVGAEEAHVKGGILISEGISYDGLGRQSASMAKAILLDGKKPGELRVEQGTVIVSTYNEETANALGIQKDHQAFQNAVPAK